MYIITKTDLQKKIGMLSDIAVPYTVVNRGKPEAIILPFFEGGKELIEDYLEDYEMWLNRDKLNEELDVSLASGDSNLII